MQRHEDHNHNVLDLLLRPAAPGKLSIGPTLYKFAMKTMREAEPPRGPNIPKDDMSIQLNVFHFSFSLLY